jgi:hypothetical protein
MADMWVIENYKSAIDNRVRVSDAIRKRCSRGQSVGPFRCSIEDVPLADLAVNSLGAVPKKGTTAMRPVDDVFANVRTVAPHFKMPTVDWLRRNATPYCWWWLVDIEDAFANLVMGSKDKQWLMFRWYDIDDTEFKGTPNDCIYYHSHGCFGPRSLPYLYTCLQFYVNLAAMASGVTSPVLGYMDDNCSVNNTAQASKMCMDLYKAHLMKAGLPAKDSKEKLPFQVGEIVGRWFNSITMTISITPDKIVELRAMLTHCCSPAARLTLKGLESVAGFWVFCQDCLPLALKTFMLSTFTWMRELRHKHQSVRHGKSYLAYVPRTVKKDVRLILGVLPLCNGKQPLQPLRGKPWQRPLMTDASDFAGGYVHPDATYNRKFTARERKAIIAVKEAKMISEAVEHNAEAWKGCVLPVYVDNSVCLHAFTRGRSRNKHINQLIRETLLTCAAYDVHPVFYFVYSTENTLADHVSRGALVEYEAALTWFCWPDTNRPLDQAPRETLLLSRDARDATAKYVSKATEASSMTTYQSGWNSWVQYCAIEGCDPYAQYDDAEEFDTVLAGFAALLAEGKFGRGKSKSANSIETYVAAVAFMRKRHFEKGQYKDVMAGVKKDKKGTVKPKKTVTLPIMCELTVNCNKQGLAGLARAVAYNQLGQGLLRSMSAVAKTESNWDSGMHLTVADVRILEAEYAVAWGLKRQKQDRFGDCLGEDGRDWVYTKGVEGPLNIYQMVTDYYEKMGFNKLTQSEKEITPFYQVMLFDRPTGRPLTYHSLLKSFRLDLGQLSKSRFPELQPGQFGLHAFRRFGATVAKLKGVPNDIIQRLGRWNSDTFLTYFVFSVAETLSWQELILGSSSENHGEMQASRPAPVSSPSRIRDHLVRPSKTRRTGAVEGCDVRPPSSRVSAASRGVAKGTEEIARNLQAQSQGPFGGLPYGQPRDRTRPTSRAPLPPPAVGEGVPRFWPGF